MIVSLTSSVLMPALFYGGSWKASWKESIYKENTISPVLSIIKWQVYTFKRFDFKKWGQYDIGDWALSLSLETQLQIPALPLTGYVSLGKPLHFSGLGFVICKLQGV